MRVQWTIDPVRVVPEFFVGPLKNLNRLGKSLRPTRKETKIAASRTQPVTIASLSNQNFGGGRETLLL